MLIKRLLLPLNVSPSRSRSKRRTSQPEFAQQPQKGRRRRFPILCVDRPAMAPDYDAPCSLWAKQSLVKGGIEPNRNRRSTNQQHQN